MEGATSHEIMACPAQRRPGVNDLDKVDPAQQLIEEFLGYASSHSPKA
jgi:hypothetical protein